MSTSTHLIASVAALALASAAPAGDGPCGAPGAWEVIATPDPAGANHSIVRDIVAISPSDVWAVGGYNAIVGGQTLTYAFSMHWDGATWTEIPTPQPSACPSCTNVTLWGVDALGPDDVWACGGKKVQSADGFLGTHILVMHWDGSSWTVLNTPIQNGASGDLLWAVEAIASDDVWFFGENIYQGPSSPDLAIALHWNGSSFAFVPVPSVNPQYSGFGDGNSLRGASVLAPDDIWAVGAASDGDSMPAGHSQIQHWNGSTWQNVPGPTPGVWHDLNAVVAITSDDVWAGGEYFDTSYHGLAMHYDGASWTQVPIPGGVSELVAFASDDVYAAGGGIMHWDGVSWTTVETFPQADSATQSGLSASGACDLWTGGRQFAGDQIVNFTAHMSGGSGGTNCPSDFDGTGDVGFNDMTLLLFHWGPCAPAYALDLDHSGDVGFSDLTEMLVSWGLCP